MKYKLLKTLGMAALVAGCVSTSRAGDVPKVLYDSTSNRPNIYFAGGNKVTLGSDIARFGKNDLFGAGVEANFVYNKDERTGVQNDIVGSPSGTDPHTGDPITPNDNPTATIDSHDLIKLDKSIVTNLLAKFNVGNAYILAGPAYGNKTTQIVSDLDNEAPETLKNRWSFAAGAGYRTPSVGNDKVRTALDLSYLYQNDAHNLEGKVILLANSFGAIVGALYNINDKSVGIQGGFAIPFGNKEYENNENGDRK